MIDPMHDTIRYETCKICGGPIRIKSRKTVDGLPMAECFDCGLLFVKEVTVNKSRSDKDELARLLIKANFFGKNKAMILATMKGNN